ncbi:MAG: hypothetical protein QOG35_2125 [Solirubrobacteraceae bacterium]|nr:hypothetical protein [Solirubrobacteraceae bacterium]
MSGRDATWALGLWALFNAALAGLLVGFRHNAVELASYWLAVATVAALAVVAWRVRDRAVRRVPEASGGAVLLAVGVVLLALGAAIGRWSALVGAELVVVALVVLVRERAG